MSFKSISACLLFAASTSLCSSLVAQDAVAVPVVPLEAATPDTARPHSWVIVPAAGETMPSLVQAPGQTTCDSTNPCYYTTAQLWTAYGLPPIQKRGNYGQGITIGIVDAYYDPQIASNLVNFSNFYRLPGGTAGSTINCASTPTLTVTNQTGGSPTGVGFNSGWAEEANLDVQQAHAMAPCANILLVAANSPSYVNLGAGVQYAAAHSDMVSNSYGGGEFSTQSTYDAIYAAQKVPLLFSSGDTGEEVEYPCISPNVTCVGGTHLLTTSSAFRTAESVWYFSSTGDGTGGGCSQYEAKPGYQVGFTESKCGARRAAPDVASLADPYTGVVIALGSNIEPVANVYCCIGGTSLATPLVAGMLANVDAARLLAGKAKFSTNLNTSLYPAAGYTPSGTSTQPAPYGNAYRSYYFDVFQGGTTVPATMYYDTNTGLGVPSFSALGNYLITTTP